MPTRILRPGLTTSERFNACDWFAQSLYVRLLTLVDDFGRYDANERILKAHAFPLSDEVQLPAIVGGCQQLSANGLAEFYAVGGKKYLQLTRWQERVRSKASKFPSPADNCQQMPAGCGQMPADASNCPPPTPYALRLTPCASSPAPCASESPRAHSHSAEVPDLKQAEAMVMTDGIPSDFIALAHADWMDNAGCNAKGMAKPWPSYVRTRWRYEGQEWKAGTHRGKTSPRPAGARLGPSLREVQEYAAEKDDGSKRAIAYAVSWWQAWEGRGWKNKAGHSIDWKIEFAKALVGHLTRA